METTQTTQKPLMRTIRCTYKLWADYMRSVAAECGVPDSYRVVLPFLLRHPGASQKDIAEFRNITTASVSQIVKEMQLTGYLKKEPDPYDGRYVKLYLTEKGEAHARELHDRTKRADERIRELLTPEKEQEMLDLLGELSVILKEKLPEDKKENPPGEDTAGENEMAKEREGSEAGKSEREGSETRKSEREGSETGKSEREGSETGKFERKVFPAGKSEKREKTGQEEATENREGEETRK